MNELMLVWKKNASSEIDSKFVQIGEDIVK